MSNKKKFVIVISIISIFIVILSVSAFADDSYTFEEETVITVQLKFPALNSFTGTLQYNNKIQFLQSDDNTYYSVIFISRGSLDGAKPSVRYNYYGGSTKGLENGYKFKIPANTTLNEEQINLLYLITDLTPPEPPPPPPQIEPSFWETVSRFFSEALTSGTAIVNWMTDTPIALIPLALYCLIVIIAITKRMIKG